MSKGSSTTTDKEITGDPLNFFCTAEALWLTDNFYNNTEIHWHVVKWPPSSHLKALSENHACEDLEKGGKGKPCIRRHNQSWGRTWKRRWWWRLSYLCLTLPRLAQEAPKSVLREELGRTKIEWPSRFRTKTQFFFFWGPQWNVGMSDAAKACSRSVKKCTVWRSCDAQNDSSTLFLLTYLTSLVTYLLTYSLIYLLID
jgi:hypothetical protein